MLRCKLLPVYVPEANWLAALSSSKPTPCKKYTFTPTCQFQALSRRCRRLFSGRMSRLSLYRPGGLTLSESLKTIVAMERFLGRYSPYLYAILRMVAGIMFAMHGSQKLFGIPGGGDPVEIGSMMGIAGIIELVTGILIAIGFLTSIAAFIASGQMAVAFFMAHAPQGLNPLLNEGELAVLYCFLFLYMAARGSGVWSVDSALPGRRVTHEPHRSRTAI